MLHNLHLTHVLVILFAFLLIPIGFVDISKAQTNFTEISDELTNQKTHEPSLNIDVLISIIVAVATALFGVWAAQFFQRKGILSNSKNAIRIEIEDTKQGLDHDTRILFSINEKEMSYVHTFFDIGAYDSIVHSGYFVQLERPIRIKITELYNRIKLNNDTIRYLETLEDRSILYSNTANLDVVKQRYQIRLVNLQNQIKTMIDEVMELLPTSRK